MSLSKYFLCECDHIYEELVAIDSKILNRAKQVVIFKDYNGSEIFLITESDDVLAFGRNFNGRLGLGHTNQVNEPTIIIELCGKGVKDIKCGQHISVALSEFGEIYTFGCGVRGLTGTGDTGSYGKPNAIGIENQLISAIDCTNFSTYLLTQTGQLYWFGYFNCNKVTAINPTNTPTKVGIPSVDEIANISCGYDYILALTVTGKVYSWGHNSNGQLGLGHNNHINSPQMIDSIENISQIFCGNNHSLLLTSDGRIYSMGYNNFEQLGIGNITDCQNTPQLIVSELKFIEICCFGNVSMAFDRNNKLYIWGNIKEKVFSPKLTEMSSFQEVFNTFGKYRRSLKPLSSNDLYKLKSNTLKPLVMENMIQTMTKAFNNSKNSDLKFKVKIKGNNTEFKYIYVHKWFIAKTSEYFKTMFANKWSENKSNEIQITEYSYESYYYYIQSLYTKFIDTNNIEELLEILSITEQYLDSDKKDKCEELIKEVTNIQNVCSVFSSASKYRSDNLKRFSFKIMAKNIEELIQTEDYKHMNPIYTKEFFTEFHEIQKK